jgi:hypothetical protein
MTSPTKVELYAGSLAFLIVILLAIWLLVYG